MICDSCGGADPNANREDGVNALIAASDKGDTEAVKLLLAAGAKVNAATSNAATALHVAALMGHIETVKLLLGAGADLNATLGDGRTPLILALQKGNTEIIKLLLESGVKVNAEIAGGATALLFPIPAGLSNSSLGMAIVSGQHVVRLGQDSGFEYRDHPEYWQIMQEFDGMSQQRCARSEHAYQVNQIGRTSAARTTEGPIPTVLITQIDKGTPLILASQNGHTETVKLLLDAGAKVNAKAGGNITALHLASLNGRIETVKLLLDAGANADFKISVGGEPYTALDIAEKQGRSDIIKLMKEHSRKQ